MQRSKTFFFLIAMFSLYLVSPRETFAAHKDTLAVENHIQTGDIHIKLEEYQLDAAGNEELYNFEGFVLPGDIISKIPRITNLAEPCYIRIFLTFPQKDSSELSGLTADQLEGISDQWIRKGDYYYYPEILSTGDSLDFFQSVSIPSHFENEYSGQELSISIQVDAIQAANFTPDFTRELPWGDQIIEICAHNQTEPDIKHPYTAHQVVYEGNSHKLITPSEDFFSNLGQMMPGDTFTDKILLKNSTASDAELFFRTALSENLTEDALDLLEHISLEIRLGEDLLYRGNLKSATLQEPVSLGRYKSGAEGVLTFTLHMPESLTNAYALRNTSVKWIFSVENEELEITTPPPVKTGDSQRILPYFVLLSLSAFIFCSYALYQIRRRNDVS